MEPDYDIVGVLPYFYPETTGHCQSCNLLFAEFSQAGLRVAMIAADRYYSTPGNALPRVERWNGIDIYRVVLPRVSRASAGRHLLQAMAFTLQALRLFRRLRARSAFSITSPPLLYAWLSWVCRRRKIPFVLWAMDLYPETLAAMNLISKDGWRHRLFRRWARKGYERCAHIFTLGPVMRARLVEAGADDQRLTDVHNWVPRGIHYIAPGDNPLYQAGNWKGKFIVHYSGNIGLVHDFALIFAAAERMLVSDPDVVFMIVGQGPRKSDLERVAREKKLDNVRFYPYAPYEQLSESLSLADLAFVTLERGFEGVIAPGKIYAYLAVGAPVVLIQGSASDLSRIVEDGIEGTIVAPHDVEGFCRYVRALKSDSTRRREARVKNRAWYDRSCDFENNGRRFIDVFQRLLSSRCL